DVPVAFWEGLAVGLVVSVTGSVVVWWYLRNRARGGGVRAAVAAPSRRASVVIPLPTPAAAAGRSNGGGPMLGLAGVNPTRPAVVRIIRETGAMEVVSDTPRPVPDNNHSQLRISHRVLVHIGAQGRVGRDEIPPKALTQAGMVEALEVNQGALTGVLRRLVAAGVLDEHREHVQGVDRRLKVYRLTSSGEQLYMDIRGRRPP
ncbi:MAG TPA: hypothetical protein VEY07_08880, partial [Thermoplasmata archaeon]|nr:hypothetical protein [Thermoplasmata archaeon]